MTTERTYQGIITVRAYGEDDGALWLDPTEPYDEPLAAQVALDIEALGNTVTVSYWITDGPRTIEQLLENEAKKLAGAADADYTERGSDVTGYLWTDAELQIGGHDLLAELESEVGRWCYLSIRFGPKEAVTPVSIERHLKVSYSDIPSLDEALSWTVQQLDGELKGASMVKIVIDQILWSDSSAEGWHPAWTAAVSGIVSEEETHG